MKIEEALNAFPYTYTGKKVFSLIDSYIENNLAQATLANKLIITLSYWNQNTDKILPYIMKELEKENK